MHACLRVSNEIDPVDQVNEENLSETFELRNYLVIEAALGQFSDIHDSVSLISHLESVLSNALSVGQESMDEAILNAVFHSERSCKVVHTEFDTS